MPGASQSGWPTPPLRGKLKEAGSTAERWARLVLIAADAESDLPTAKAWAATVGVSYSTLRDVCNIVRVSTHDSRDFMRLLRALLRTGGDLDHIEDQLYVGDERTLASLLRKTGLHGHERSRVTIDEFVQRQCFIPAERPVLTAVSRLLSGLLVA